MPKVQRPTKGILPSLKEIEEAQKAVDKIPTRPAIPGSLAEKLEKVDVQELLKERDKPLWKGPGTDGVTFSMLSRFLVCRERFKLYAMQGWKTADKFNPLMEYGNLWHAAEEALAARQDWKKALAIYANSLLNKYPFQREEIDHWYLMADAEFPHYVNHWAEHPDVIQRTQLFQEQVFSVPYILPSGRIIKLRGKWDSVDLIGAGTPEVGIYIQENKTKSTIDPYKIGRQIVYDLQSMMYMTALQEEVRRLDDSTIKSKCSYKKGSYRHFYPIAGVRYNVVRRPAHKSIESMVKKILSDKEEDRAGEWFSRWKVEVSQNDLKQFQKDCLNPILEQLYDWWEVQTFGAKDAFALQMKRYQKNNFITPVSYRQPYGIYNVLHEGGTGDLDALLNEGSTVGLRRVNTLFPELEGA